LDFLSVLSSFALLAKLAVRIRKPSLWRESLGRVPIEAMANGIPVLASDRGALPETLRDAGFVFTIPDRCTPAALFRRPKRLRRGWP
jgi:glycosyltransferase involved in cell wall biosynthesis